MPLQEQFYLYSDASLSNKDEVAIGAVLFLTNEQMEQLKSLSIEEIEKKIAQKLIYKKITTKRSTYAEMQTLNLALEAIEITLQNKPIIHVYTDCENICYLFGERKAKLIQSKFKSKTGKELKNKDIYMSLLDKLRYFDILTHKIKGHCKEKYKTSIEAKIFSFIDKRARRKMRQILNTNNTESTTC
jgi:hypothetical protein